MRDTETERERKRQRYRQREKQAPRREPDRGLGPRTLGVMPWARGRCSAAEPPRRPNFQPFFSAKCFLSCTFRFFISSDCLPVLPYIKKSSDLIAFSGK